MEYLLWFRALPFVAYVGLSRRFAGPERLLWVLSFVAITGLAFRRGSLRYREALDVCAVLVYFAVLGAGVHQLPVAAVLRRSRPMVFGLLFAACIAVPARAVGAPGLAVTVVVIGWEVMLSAYSYLVEVSRARVRPACEDCLFFLLVNPCVVYVGSVKPAQAGRVTSGARLCAMGVAALVTGGILVDGMGANAQARPDDVRHIATVQDYGRELVLYLSRFSAHYLSQYGVAIFRTGMIALAGFEIPRCFARPYAAVGPAEFWQRWNMWVGNWARRYLFLPLDLALQRKTRQGPRFLAATIAVVWSFGVIGLLHDAAKYCASPVKDVTLPQPKGLVFFGLNAVILLTWALAKGERAATPAGPRTVVVRNLQRVLWLHLLFAAHAVTLWLLPGAVAQAGGW